MNQLSANTSIWTLLPPDSFGRTTTMSMRKSAFQFHLSSPGTPLMELLYDLHLLSQSFYWKRFGIAFKSWCFRMSLTEDDLKNKVQENKLGVYSIYCDKSQWGRGDGTKNFWNSINEGHEDMHQEYFGDI